MRQRSLLPDLDGSQAPRQREGRKVWRSVASLLRWGLVILTIEATAIAFGLWNDFPICSFVIVVASLVGSLLALVAIFLPSRMGSPHQGERLVGSGLVLFVTLATVTEQFMWITTEGDVAVAWLWLTPVMVAGLLLPRVGWWLTGVASWLIFFAGAAAASRSGSSGSSGMGLFFGWLG